MNERRSDRESNMPSEDLEARWEEVLRGGSSQSEEASVREEISNSGRPEEFDAQSEISQYVKNYLPQDEPSHRFYSHYEQLADEEHRLKSHYGRAMLWKGASGTIAASLALFLVLAGANVWINQPSPSELIADTSRRLWNRTMLEGLEQGKGDITVKQLMVQFEKKLRYKPQFHIEKLDSLDLVSGRVEEMGQKKVVNVLMRAGDKPVLLSIYRVKDNPQWADLPENEWVINADEYPRTVLWRKEKFIYSMTGYAKIKTFKELTQKIDPDVLMAQ